jgi:mannosyltransferase
MTGGEGELMLRGTTAAAPRAAPDPAGAAAGRSTVPVTVLVVAETLLAAALGLWRLGHNSVWADEAYTWSTVSRSWSSFVDVVTHHEGGGVLHSLFTFFWIKVGDSPTWLRLPSVFFAALTVPLVYRAARQLFDERTGLIAGLLLAMNGTVLFYAQEARTYALTVLLVAGSFSFFVEEMKQPSRASFLGWISCSAAAVYALPLAGAVVVAEAVSLLFARPSDLRVRRLVQGFTSILVLVIPMAAVQISQARGGKLNQFLEGNRTPGFVLRSFLALSGGGGPPLILAYGALVCVALATGFTLWRRSGRSIDVWSIGLPLCWVVVPCVLVVASSYVTPNFASRYFLMSVPGLSVVAAFGLVRLTARSGRLLVVGLVIIAALASVGVYRYYFRYHSDDFRDAVAFMLERRAPGDAVAFIGDEARLPFEYYTRDRQRDRDGLIPVFPDRAWGDFGTGDAHEWIPTMAQTAAMAQDHQRLWVFRRYDGNPAESSKRFALLARGHRVHQWQFEDTVRLYLYERSAP